MFLAECAFSLLTSEADHGRKSSATWSNEPLEFNEGLAINSLSYGNDSSFHEVE